MNAATEIDLGPLTWVKGEIDPALERAEDALGLYAVSADVTQLKFCRTHVHQVHGALSIVGLDGVTLVTESLEALLTALEEARLHADERAMAALHEALAGIHLYLDELMAGEANQPVRLLPVYQELAAVRGIATAQASDLFFPDLSLRPPKRQAAAAAMDPEALRQVLKKERAAEALAGSKLIKLKLTDDKPVDRVRAVRAARPDARIIVDANQGFTLPLLKECLPEFAKAEVELVEQPLARGDDAALEGMPREVPICADESCHDRASLSGLAGRYDMVNIKLDKAGGLTEALPVRDGARAAGFGVMVGCMVASSLSMAPAFVVAQGAEVADLDGPLILARDREPAVRYDGSVMQVPDRALWG